MKIDIQRQFRTRFIVQAIAVVAVACTIKLWYSLSNVNDLWWILTPTTFVVELLTGEEFWFESYAGYMSTDHSFLIADSCSGVNFLIMAFLMLGLMQVRRAMSGSVSWMFIPAVLAAAYFSTIVANTVRITAALRAHRMSPEMIWINPEQLHLIEGIFIYFGFLLFLFIVAEQIENARSPRTDRRQGSMLRSLIPLSIYWAIALGIPLLNGAHRQGVAFWEHSLFVVLTPAIIILPVVIIQRMLRRRYIT
jgi:exosortase K